MDDVISVSANMYHTLAIKTDGSLWAWGEDLNGKFGNGITKYSSTPIKVPLDDVASVSAGERHTLAVKTDGSLWTWGRNMHGELGDGTMNDSDTPVMILGSPQPTYNLTVETVVDNVIVDFASLGSFRFNQ